MRGIIRIKSRKGDVFFMWLLLIFTVATLTYALVMVVSSFRNVHEGIGEKQFELMNKYMDGSKAMLFLGDSAFYSAQSADYEELSNGGFFNGSPCSRVGLTSSWGNETGQCLPDFDQGFREYLNMEMKRLSSSYPLIDLSNNRYETFMRNKKLFLFALKKITLASASFVKLPSIKYAEKEYKKIRKRHLQDMNYIGSLSSSLIPDRDAKYIIAAQISAESSWNPTAIRCEDSVEDKSAELISRLGCSPYCDSTISYKGGRHTTFHKVSCSYGVAQTMFSTLWEAGFRDDPMILLGNSHKSIEYGVSYLAGIYKKMGSWKDSLAAYNAGEGNVNRAKKKCSSTTFEGYAPCLPMPEITVPYVYKILFMAKVFKDEDNGQVRSYSDYLKEIGFTGSSNASVIHEIKPNMKLDYQTSKSLFSRVSNDLPVITAKCRDDEKCFSSESEKHETNDLNWIVLFNDSVISSSKNFNDKEDAKKCFSPEEEFINSFMLDVQDCLATRDDGCICPSRLGERGWNRISYGDKEIIININSTAATLSAYRKSALNRPLFNLTLRDDSLKSLVALSNNAAFPFIGSYRLLESGGKTEEEAEYLNPITHSREKISSPVLYRQGGKLLVSDASNAPSRRCVHSLKRIQLCVVNTSRNLTAYNREYGMALEIPYALRLGITLPDTTPPMAVKEMSSSDARLENNALILNWTYTLANQSREGVALFRVYCIKGSIPLKSMNTTVNYPIKPLVYTLKHPNASSLWVKVKKCYENKPLGLSLEDVADGEEYTLAVTPVDISGNENLNLEAVANAKGDKQTGPYDDVAPGPVGGIMVVNKNRNAVVLSRMATLSGVEIIRFKPMSNDFTMRWAEPSADEDGKPGRDFDGYDVFLKKGALTPEFASYRWFEGNSLSPSRKVTVNDDKAEYTAYVLAYDHNNNYIGNFTSSFREKKAAYELPSCGDVTSTG